MTIAVVWQFIQDHEAVISLFGLAFVVTMPDDLPAPFNRAPFLVWCWNWLHTALKTFVSFRAPVNTQATTYRQETPTSTTQTTETKTTATVAPIEVKP